MKTTALLLASVLLVSATSVASATGSSSSNDTTQTTSSNATSGAVAGGGAGTATGNAGDYSTKNSAGPVVMYNQNPIPLPQAVTSDSTTVLSDVYQFGPFGYGTQRQRMTPSGAESWLKLARQANENDGTYTDQQRQFAAIATLCADEGGFGENLAEQLGVACK